MEPEQIFSALAGEEAVLTDMHFVYTTGQRGGNHGTGYVNMRRAAHRTVFLSELGEDLASVASDLELDMVIGPETLGRTLAGYAAAHLRVDHIWCDIIELEDRSKVARFNPKLDFGRLVPGKRFLIVDDLLTSGGSIALVAELIRQHGGTVVAAVVVVRRSPDVTAMQCSVPELWVLAEIAGFEVLTRDECEAKGPCSRGELIVRRPGHGWKLEELEPDAQPGFRDL